MHVLIRPESIDDAELMGMLKSKITAMICKLTSNGILLNDNSVIIWIKSSNGQLFPKIEFESLHQELQYDIAADGFITETHFKKFIKTDNGSKRFDIKRENADKYLQTIDYVIKYK